MSAKALSLQMTTHWRQPLVALAIALAAVLVLHLETFRGMVDIWMRSETFAHAFLVPPIALWLVWRRRADLAPVVPAPAAIWLLPVAVMALAWILGQIVAANAVMQLSASAMLVLSVPLILGTHVARIVLFPLAYLFFAVPIGEFMVPPLMQWTADFTVAAVRFSGVPVYREGLQFVIPSGRWSVVEACSGVRYLMASFMVGSLFAYLNYQSPRRRWIFAGISLVVPIVANWLRAYMIVMLGHLSGNKIAVGVDHLLYGWVFFGVVIMALFWIGARWAEDTMTSDDRRAIVAAAAVDGTTSAHRGLLVVACLVLLAGLPRAIVAAMDSSVSNFSPSVVLPKTLATDWTATAPSSNDWQPAFKKPAATAAAKYSSTTGRVVAVHVSYYRNQGEGRKLVSSGNSLVDAEERYWNLLSTTTRSAPSLGGTAVRESIILAREQTGGPARERLRIWYLYRVGSTWTASDASARMLLAAQRLRGGGDDGAVVFLATPETESGDSVAVLDAFIAEHWQSIEGAIDKVRIAGRP